MDPILPTTPAPPPATSPQPPPSDGTAKAIYILYLLSLVSGITSLIGVIMAYVYIGDAPELLKTHYRLQIRTFWIGLLYACVSLLLSLAVVGIAGFVFVAVWLIVRSVKGLKALDRREPYPNVTTWLW
jgi:uncharacterized membrane protein